MCIQKVGPNGNLVPLVNTDEVAPIQAVGSTFIRNMKISVNGRETFNANSLYSYKAYMDTELSYTPDVKRTYLGLSGYAPDALDQNDVAGSGFQTRKDTFAQSGAVQLISKIDADLFNQEKLLVNNVGLDIEIHPQHADFLLHAPDPNDNNVYKFVIVGCKLYIKCVYVMDGLSLNIASALEKTPARYALRKTDLKSVFISPARSEISAVLFTEQVPRRVIIGLVASDAYNGSVRKTPFKFEPFDIREIVVNANGNTVPSVAYDLDFNGIRFARPYHDMYEGLGLANSNESNGISLPMFKNGWTLFVFDLTANIGGSEIFELIREGTTIVTARFRNPIPAGGVTLIAYGEFDSLLQLDKSRTVTTDLTV